MTDIQARYRSFNEQLAPWLIFHVGIDAGFFAELTYMIHAMLFCARRGLQFRLYSADANFAFSDTGGWNDYFLPFCPEVSEAFHSRYNVHNIPSWPLMWRRAVDKRQPQLLWWKLKTQLKAHYAHVLCRRAYGMAALTSHDVYEPGADHYDLPGLGFSGTYLEAFRLMAQVVWHLNEPAQAEVDSHLATLHLPPHYVGTQVRGGDKATEVELQPVRLTIDTLRRQDAPRHVFVLTDDYSLFRQLQADAPDFTFYTLCTQHEHGYVNSSFSQTRGEAKRTQMLRFLAQIEALRRADSFVGSITNGPSLFLLKMMGSAATPIDCARADFPRLCHQPIAVRGQAAHDFLASMR